MQRIRICQLITELELAGAERMVYELATRLDRDRFEVQVVALRGGCVADMLGRAGIPTTVLGVRGKWDFPKLAKLAAVLRGGGTPVDLLHTHLFHADLAGRLAARRAGVKHIVHTVHLVEQRWRPWQFAFQRWTDRGCDRTICVSRSAMEHHSARTHLPASRYAVIPNGVDDSLFSPSVPGRAAARQRWGFTDREIVVAYVGRLAEEKGIDTLLASIDRVMRSDAGTAVRFVLAGDGPLRSRVEEFIGKEGPRAERCRYLGFSTEVAGVLQGADVFAMASLGEGFGVAMAEAMAVGLACVGSDVTGLRDVIADGQTGLLVPAMDSKPLADAILQLAGDVEFRTRLGAAARASVLAKYSIGQTIKAHEDLYLKIINS